MRWNAREVSAIGIRQRTGSRIAVVVVSRILGVGISLGYARCRITLDHIVSHIRSRLDTLRRSNIGAGVYGSGRCRVD